MGSVGVNTQTALAPLTFGSSLAVAEGLNLAKKKLTPSLPGAAGPQQNTVGEPDEDIKKKAKLAGILDSVRGNFGAPGAGNTGRQTLFGN